MTGSQLSFTWSARREGNLGWVLERCGTYFNEFGPMPAHSVPLFIEGRRRMIAMLMERHGALYVLESLPTSQPLENHHDATSEDKNTRH